MTRPVQVTFRNMAVAPSLEHEVCARAAWLETFYDEIVGCRVLIEFPHRHRSGDGPFMCASSSRCRVKTSS